LANINNKIKKQKKMKKITAILTLVVITTLFSFKNQQQAERNYTIILPEHLIQPFYSIINGGSVDNLTVGQMKELTKVINDQVQPQYAKYFREDSIANAKNKPDTTHKK